ncbi:hypothetical protein D046_1548A, partial [Vibrio parahaemolyticus V-223/04]
MKTGIR